MIQKREQHIGARLPATAAMPARRRHWLLAIALATLPIPLSAQILGIDLTFQSVAGGVSLSGSGTGTAALNFGTVSAFGSVPTGLTRVRTASDFTMDTSFGVRVTKGILPLSANYTLRARLVSPDSLTWEVNNINMSTSFANVATNQDYATTYSHELEFTIPFSQSAGAVNTQIEVLAIAN